MPDALPTTSDEAFRLRFRHWLEAHYPSAWRQDSLRPFRRLRGDQVRAWIDMLNAGGWRAPSWPQAYGGLGLTFAQQVIYAEELERIGAARVIDLGEVQLGPTLMLHGSEAQKKFYLPKILSGEHLWCQGYSEPGAGSDLASLSTTGVIDGDDILVTGQKIWTTHANESTHVFALVRTARKERRQDGITFLLIPIDTPGVTVRPINNLAGEDEFCEVFFDAARVPLSQIVGEIDQGWSVSKSLLGYERVWIGSPALAARALTLSRALLEAGDAEGELRDRYARCAVDLHDIRALYSRICRAIGEGHEPGAEVSMLKILSSELQQRASELNLDLGQGRVAVEGACEVGGVPVDLAWQYYMSRPQAIFAGTNEIQRNLLARAVLGMPS
ncbi:MULTISPECIES: acyl-CoA dehydrogenase family protein [unclassified Brevundimonas]|uniref:acyl-CoA dehydrogenase family protein n=1 Tax=unclassified Brevundimonas TaxID=2622653 RepID=UPI0025C2FFE6|nr:MULTISPECIES: acyl-CoA dehydrogenase family protein [unclassified Brevundimonas]